MNGVAILSSRRRIIAQWHGRCFECKGSHILSLSSPIKSRSGSWWHMRFWRIVREDSSEPGQTVRLDVRHLQYIILHTWKIVRSNLYSHQQTWWFQFCKCDESGQGFHLNFIGQFTYKSYTVCRTAQLYFSHCFQWLVSFLISCTRSLFYCQ